MPSGQNIILAVAAFIFPPITAGFISGCSADLFISIALTLMGFLPGILHALWLVYRRVQAEEKWGPGGYRYISSGAYEGYPVLSGANAQGYGSTRH